jgi:alpha-L-arabinofuranosidase
MLPRNVQLLKDNESLAAAHAEKVASGMLVKPNRNAPFASLAQLVNVTAVVGVAA